MNLFCSECGATLNLNFAAHYLGGADWTCGENCTSKWILDRELEGLDVETCAYGWYTRRPPARVVDVCRYWGVAAAKSFPCDPSEESEDPESEDDAWGDPWGADGPHGYNGEHWS